MNQKPGPERPMALPREWVLVHVDELKAILKVVPGWVPMGAPGDNEWTPESLTVKERLMELAGLSAEDLYR